VGAIRSDEGLTLETSAFESLYDGQFRLSTQSIKPNFLKDSTLTIFLPVSRSKIFYPEIHEVELWRLLRKEIDNFLLFEEPAESSPPASIIEKHHLGQNSLKRAKISRILASLILEGKVK